MSRVHFVGVAGNGMSALAGFHVLGGGQATGSDRAFDCGQAGGTRRKLEDAGIRIFPQDGSAIAERPNCVVSSGAVENEIPDLKAARQAGVSIRSRAQELSTVAGGFKTVAVAGTSGKSTVAAMIFRIFSEAGFDPSLITGAELVDLSERHALGNVWRGQSEWLIIEADESDGSLIEYHPWMGLLLNAGKDHGKNADEMLELFSQFKAQCGRFAVSDDPSLQALKKESFVFGLNEGDARARDIELSPAGSKFKAANVDFSISCPGLHNVQNALAALAAGMAAGIPPQTAALALSRYRGVLRRFEIVGEENGVRVVDDFAHNPSKISAAIGAAKLSGGRVLAVFQIHGFGPARFLKDDLSLAFSRALGPKDILWLPEIYDAGGTADRDISASDIATAAKKLGVPARFVPRREDIIPEIALQARPGDTILVMGARDPSLGAFARTILSAMKKLRS
ncbi:MAG: glutamate ligase domain-containing protein [Elusimicrobiota bacterium]